MSIASAITNKQQQVADCYTAISNKGGTLPATQNLSNLPTAISSIPSGGSAPVITSLSVTPTTSAQTITAPSGTDGYSPVNVSAVTASIDQNISAGNIKSGVSILGVTGTYEGEGFQQKGNFWVDTNGNCHNIGTDVNNDSLNATGGILPIYQDTISVNNAYYGASGKAWSCDSVSEVYLTALKTISAQYAFRYAFYDGVTNEVSVYIPNLTTVSADYGLASMFQNLKYTLNLEFTSLNSIAASKVFNEAFRGCRNLAHIYFNSLTSSSFGVYIDQFDSMFYNNYNVDVLSCKLHFPNDATLKTKIQSLTGYPLFGARSGRLSIVYDLPAAS